MKRRTLLVAVGVLAAAPLLRAQTGRIARVGILATSSVPTADEWARSPFRIKLNELGWVEGRNLTIERRHAASASELPMAARELAAMKLDVIYAGGSPSLRAARQEVTATPIVMFTVGDPVASGWVKNLARPEGNVTGVAGIAGARMQGLTDIPDPMTFEARKRIVELAAHHRTPAIFESSAFADASGLIAYGPDYQELSRRVAIYVDRILRGAKPGDLPVEFPTKFELVINLKTARALGIGIPQSVLLRADRVIE